MRERRFRALKRRFWATSGAQATILGNFGCQNLTQWTIFDQFWERKSDLSACIRYKSYDFMLRVEMCFEKRADVRSDRSLAFFFRGRRQWPQASLSADPARSGVSAWGSLTQPGVRTPVVESWVYKGRENEDRGGGRRCTKGYIRARRGVRGGNIMEHLWEFRRLACNLRFYQRYNIFGWVGLVPSLPFGRRGAPLWPPEPVRRSLGTACGALGVPGMLFRCPLGPFRGGNRSET